ncbi:MAG: amino acid adenylation domain-containing protein [Nostoc sp.]
MVPSAIVILESLPLTPNGKIDRRALPAPESRTGIEIDIVPPRTPIEEKLAQIWTQILRVEPIGIHDNFFELGGDSILSIQIIAKAKLLGIELTLKQLFGNQTIAQLATVAGTTKALLIEQGLVAGTLPLTPIQQWFFEQDTPEKHHFNQSLLLTVPSNINLEILEQVWQKLLKHHDALRLRFSQTDSTWQQTHTAPTDSNTILYFDLSTIRESQLQKTIETTANSLQASLNLSENLVQVALFFLGNDKKARLLIVIHHLVVDGVSWRILLEDLQTGYEQLSRGQSIQLPAKTTSFKDWAQQLTAYAQSEVNKSELAYWLSQSHSLVSPIPVDYAEGVNTAASANTISVSLNSAETLSLLQDVPKAYKTQINDVLLTALVLVLSRWTNSKSVLFNLEGHGREDIIDSVDLSRTIGWFTTIFPVLLKLEAIDKDNIGNALKSVKEQLRAIPNKGIGYGLLRYLNSDAEISGTLETIPASEISFNYLGQFTQVLNTSSLMQPASESSGISQSLQGQRSSLLDINAIIANERLQIDWAYSTNIHQHETIENIAQEFVETLREIIAHCLEPENGGYTPTDFPLVKLNQLELDGVLARLPLQGEVGKTNWQNIQDIYPLSTMQEGMLFESLYAPDSGVYFEQITCTLTGNLDVEAFSQAWQQVVEKHSIFRTAFVWESLSQPLQVVYREVLVRVMTIDWGEFSKVEQQEQLETFLSAERQQGFQLSLAPLIRLYLIQLDSHSYQFVWCHHHLLLDGWSLPLVFKDLLEFYQAISQGVSLPNNIATLGYRNYIAWLQQQDQDLAKEFWRQKLQGFTAPTPMTVDKPLSKQEQHSSYGEQEIQLTVSETTAIGSFARQHQLTISNLVQATWGLLLCRYSGEPDVVFGATVSGRPPGLVGVESMVGLFINTLPVRVQISEKTELLSLLKDLQAQQVESEQFSYSSLAQIQALSDVKRGTSLFESIVVFENYPVDTAVVQSNGSFSLSNVRAIEQTNYPLTVLAASGEQFLLKVSYDASRFEYGTISRMLGHFVTMLSAIVANPQQHLGQLPLLTAWEQRQLLVEWNDTQVDYPQDLCIHQLFEEQVERTPDAVAVVFENQQLTYRELNSRANQLAHYLQTLGVGADVLVGICVERSLEMLVGLLGILKAGGAYVPLDPEYPTERLSFMLEDAQVKVLLTQQHLVEKLPEHIAQLELVCLDSDWEKIAQKSESSPENGAISSNLAYVIYTSGSTGKPKGVLVNHNHVTRLFAATEPWYDFNSIDVWTLFHSYAFDFSVWEIWGALLYGGRLVVVPYLVTRSPESFYELLCEEKVTILNQTPSAFRQLIAAEQSIATVGDLNLRLVIFGGETLEINSLQPWFERHGDQSPQLVNMYGITETTVHVTYRPLNKGDLNSTASVIGRPIRDLQVYVLDEHLQLVPIGVPGEMYVGGAGVTRGYLNLPELTAERFIPNLFENSKLQIPNSKLYKTGDLARYLADGNIEYLGRIDNQVKIRGFRIELGEIEAVLSQHEDVQASCVIARVDNPSDQRLVAYIVPQKEQTCSERSRSTPTVSVLRQFLKAKLPDYMVPSTFVILESLPLTLNGKIDRRALPEPSGRSGSDTFVSPRNTVELQLVQIWSKILKVDNVGVKDNFFDLGGHSLLAPYLITQIKQQLGKDIPLVTLFQHPTIEELATMVQKDTDASGWSPLVAIQPMGSKPAFFCLPGAGGFPFYLYNLARCLGSDQPFYTFQAQDRDVELAAISQVEDIAAHYIQAIQAVQPQGPYFLAGHSFGGKVVYEMAQQLLSQGQVVALVAILDTTAPIAQAKPEEWDDVKWLIETAKLLQIAFAKDLDMDADPLFSLAPEEQFKYVLDYFKMVDILPPDADTRYLKKLLQAFKADGNAEYVPQHINAIAITLFRASESAPEEPTALPSELLEDLAWGWSAFSSEPVDVQFVPGSHVTMMTQPHVQVLAERLKACIEQVQANI